jgi:hypothetical protein
LEGRIPPGANLRDGLGKKTESRGIQKKGTTLLGYELRLAGDLQ